ncbi:MAG: TRAP transporter small permease subunit [Myxococcota bacterium]
MSSKRASGVLGGLQAVDDSIYKGERWAIVGVIAGMTISIFLAVLWRVFAEPEGRVEALMVEALGDTGGVRMFAKALTFLGFAALCGFAARTARKDWSIPVAAGVGITVAAGIVAVGLGFVWLLPFGLVFSQRLALALLMWMVFLGSSMAAYRRRHIVVQAALKLVPDPVKHLHAAAGLFLAAGFTAFLWYVSTRYSLEMFDRWVDSEFRSAKFDSIPIPYWAVTTAVTVGLGLTLFRFVLQAVLILNRVIPAVPLTEEDEALAAVAESAEAET